jgi:two-component system, chemotaxis family, response regulator WspF
MRIGIVHAKREHADILQRVVGLRPEHRVVWLAQTGAEALALCAKAAPDLVLIDPLSAESGGLQVIRQLRASTTCAILVVTDNVRSNAGRVFEAMGCGAIDAVDIPASGVSLEQSAVPLLAKLETVSRLMKDHYAGAHRHGSGDERPPLVAIGASAGGPAALATLLGGLPADFAGAVVIVQHVDALFASGLAAWLSDRSGIPVAVAKHGEPPTAGRALVAGTAGHLIVDKAGLLAYTPEPRDAIYRPSIDTFFHSVLESWTGTTVGVLLTGMGRDGAIGLKAFRDRGHHTIAQNEATSAVYGMPKEAASLNAAVDILPVDHVADRLVRLISGRRIFTAPALTRPVA